MMVCATSGFMIVFATSGSHADISSIFKLDNEWDFLFFGKFFAGFSSELVLSAKIIKVIFSFVSR